MTTITVESSIVVASLVYELAGGGGGEGGVKMTPIPLRH